MSFALDARRHREGEHLERGAIGQGGRVKNFQICPQGGEVRIGFVLLNGGDDRIGSNKTGDVINMTVGVIAFDAVLEPDDLGDSEPVAEFFFDLLLVEGGIPIGIKEAAGGGEQGTLSIGVYGTPFEDEMPAVENRQIQFLGDTGRDFIVKIAGWVFPTPGVVSKINNSQPWGVGAFDENRSVVAAPGFIGRNVEKLDLVAAGLPENPAHFLFLRLVFDIDSDVLGGGERFNHRDKRRKDSVVGTGETDSIPMGPGKPGGLVGLPFGGHVITSMGGGWHEIKVTASGILTKAQTCEEEKFFPEPDLENARYPLDYPVLMPTVFLKTYGCQMNERDSAQVASMLRERGFRMVEDESDADVILLNTCSVRDMAEQKAIGKMGMVQTLRRRRPHLVTGYLGCMAQSRGEELLKATPQVDLVVGTQKFHRVADYVSEIYQRKTEELMDDERRPIVDVAEEVGSQSTIREQSLRERQSSAFVSIMQGCNMRCTFCIVPDTRGAERSRPIGEIVSEVRELAARGVREVTLLGQIVNLYGRHEFPREGGKSPFVQLLEAVHEVEEIQRIRFTSPHPIGFRADLIEALASLPRLMEHVHLPLQSGSDRLLKLMHRGYTAEKFRALVGALRTARPEMAITTDLIVGFPGETDEDHAATRAMVQELEFDNAFVFRYSPRRDTPAANSPDQIEESIKESRHQDLLGEVNEVVARKLAARVGYEEEVLCEGASRHNPDRLSGRSRTNKIVVFAGNPRLIGEIFPVRIVRASGNTLYGEV